MLMVLTLLFRTDILDFMRIKKKEIKKKSGHTHPAARATRPATVKEHFMHMYKKGPSRLQASKLQVKPSHWPLIASHDILNQHLIAAPCSVSIRSLAAQPCPARRARLRRPTGRQSRYCMSRSRRSRKKLQ